MVMFEWKPPYKGHLRRMDKMAGTKVSALRRFHCMKKKGESVRATGHVKGDFI